MKKSLLFILVMICFIIGTNAQIIHVTSGLLTIQAGIDSSANGDTVLVAEGIYFENINFKGKAITVASQFIMDGDTSHISKTIIDGSQPTNPDTASVVTMCSGEDTTSVLMGFTLTGGSGTIVTYYDNTYTGGGGVLIINSGCKIIHNTIEENHLADLEINNRGALGCGILANVNHNHTAIIRNNIIRNNSSTAGGNWGGGISLLGGRMLLENNFILNNTINLLNNYTCGAGIFFEPSSLEGVIFEVIIRNNLIVGNAAYGYYADYVFGAGMTICGLATYQQMQIYNNVIAENFSDGYGGGFYTCCGRSLVYNNTIINNEAKVQGNSIAIDAGGRILMYDNIVWSNAEDTISEYVFWGHDNSVTAYYNILKDSFKTDDPVTEVYNKSLEPLFKPDSYEPAENSPAIGWGRDSLEVDGTWYYAPSSDIFGHKKPDPVDPYVDAGAVESTFPRPVYHNSDIVYIGLRSHHKLCPDFHKDTLHYILRVPDTTIVTPQLDVISWDWLAEININDADSIPSDDPADRTTTITVTADDGYTPKIYTVQFVYMSADASLSSLTISKGSLVPDFHPDSLIYTVCLPIDQKIPPEVTCESTDSNATVHVKYAPNILLPDPWNQYREYRTTVITVTAEDGIHKAKYEIEHIINKTLPIIALVNTAVDSIGVTSTEDGYIYLVPANTSRNLDSIMAHWIDSATVEAGITAYLSIPNNTVIYWLFAIDNCLNISEPATLDGISKNWVATLRLYPIPVDQTLYIETNEAISSVELFNIVGIKVLDKSNPEGRIDIGHLEQGIYLIRIKTDKGKMYTRKVVKR